MTDFWLSKAWYLAFWVLIFIMTRLWLVNPLINRLDQILHSVQRSAHHD